MPDRSPTSQSRRIVGPLERGHHPVSVVRGVVSDELPEGWRIFDVFELKGRRVKFILTRPDRLTYHYEIGYDQIDAGDTRVAVRQAIEDLRRRRP